MPIRGLTAGELTLFTCYRALDRFRPNVAGGDDVLIEHTHASAGDGTHRQLFMTRHAELADDEDVEPGLEGNGYFERDGHPAAREGQHHDIAAVGILSQ